MVLRAKQPPFNIIIVDFISGINKLPGLEGFMLVFDVLNQSTELCVEHINCKNKMAKVTFLKMEATTGLAPPTSVSMTEYNTFKVPFLSLTVCPSTVSSSKSLLSVSCYLQFLLFHPRNLFFKCYSTLQCQCAGQWYCDKGANHVRKLDFRLHSADSGYKSDKMAGEFWLRFYRMEGNGVTTPLVEHRNVYLNIRLRKTH